MAITAAILAAGGCGTAGASPETVVITIRHSRFLPSEVSVKSGATVRFVIRNEDPIDHEFILGDEEVQKAHEDGTHPYHGDIPGEVTVPAGEQATTSFTFTSTGTQIFGCHFPGHYDYGMHGVVHIR